MALCNLLKPEKLEKENKYLCEKCEKKVFSLILNQVDAMKIVNFEKLQKILIMQINRFEYDRKTESRRKIFDKVTFPQVLDINIFLKYIIR